MIFRRVSWWHFKQYCPVQNKQQPIYVYECKCLLRSAVTTNAVQRFTAWGTSLSQAEETLRFRFFSLYLQSAGEPTITTQELLITSQRLLSFFVLFKDFQSSSFLKMFLPRAHQRASQNFKAHLYKNKQTTYVCWYILSSRSSSFNMKIMGEKLPQGQNWSIDHYIWFKSTSTVDAPLEFANKLLVINCNKFSPTVNIRNRSF